jgi:hypothetical protein
VGALTGNRFHANLCGLPGDVEFSLHVLSGPAQSAVVRFDGQASGGAHRQHESRICLLQGIDGTLKLDLHLGTACYGMLLVASLSLGCVTRHVAR